jgi:hypothetical protein
MDASDYGIGGRPGRSTESDGWDVWADPTRS